MKENERLQRCLNKGNVTFIPNQLFPYSVLRNGLRDFLIWRINVFHFEIFHPFNQFLAFSACDTAIITGFLLFGSNMRNKSTIFPARFLLLCTVIIFYLSFLMTSFDCYFSSAMKYAVKVFCYFFLTRSAILASLTKWLFFMCTFCTPTGKVFVSYL